LAVQCQHVPKASAAQINAFFGISGTQSIWGGQRGREFLIQGVFVGTSWDELAAAEQILLSYDDGIARVLTDTWGVSWPSVIFQSHYQRQGKPVFGSTQGDGGVIVPVVYQPYKATFHGLV
jgi:hypothetical protein